MSWDQILAALGANKGTPQPAQPGSPTNPNPEISNSLNQAPPAAPTSGAETPGIGKKIGDTLLGSSPRTDSPANFVGDTLHGMTSPHGLIGQATRLIGAIAAFGHSPQMGLQYLNFLDTADAGERKDLAQAAAYKMTPEEYTARTGQQVPADTRTALQARDAAPGGPSLPDRVNTIQFPNTPEELTQAMEAETKQARMMPDFQGTMASGAQAQRMGLPTDFQEKTKMTEEAVSHIPPGQYSEHYTAGDEGLKAVMSTLPPEDRDMTPEAFQSWTVPQGFTKIALPGSAPGTVVMKVVNEHGDNVWDILRAAANGDETAKTMLGLYPTSKGTGKPPKAGSYEEQFARVNALAHQGQGLTPGEASELKALYGAGKNDLKPGESAKKLQDFLIRVGAQADPAEVAAEQERTRQLEELAKKPNASEAPPQGQAPSNSPFALAPTGQRIVEAVKKPVEAIGDALSTIPVDSPAYIPPSQQPKPLPKKFQKKGFQELSPDDFSAFAQDVLATLTRTQGDLSAAGEELAGTMQLMKLSNEEKALVIHQISEELGLPQSTRLQIEKEAIKRLGD